MESPKVALTLRLACSCWVSVLFFLGTLGLCTGAEAQLSQLRSGLVKLNPMRFTVVPSAPSCIDCPSMIVADGDIVDDTIETYKAAVGESDAFAFVLINSRGGNLSGASKLGIELRRQNRIAIVGQRSVSAKCSTLDSSRCNGKSLSTSWGSIAPGICYSACAYLLAGAYHRFALKGSKIGVHQAWDSKTTNGKTLLSWQPSHRGALAASERKYLSGMKIDAHLVDLEDGYEPWKRRELSETEMRNLKLAEIVPDLSSALDTARRNDLQGTPPDPKMEAQRLRATLDRQLWRAAQPSLWNAIDRQWWKGVGTPVPKTDNPEQ